MTTFHLAVAFILLACLCGGMVRVFRGPLPEDRMLAGQLFGTVAVAVLVLIAHVSASGVLVDAALVLALLASVTVVAFVRSRREEIDTNAPRD